MMLLMDGLMSYFIDRLKAASGQEGSESQALVRLDRL